MALIVTIIVLLILAGVSIATLAGNNGLISRTTIAKEATRAGEVKELVRLEAQANKIAETTNDTRKTRSAVIAELVADGKLTSAEADEIQSAETPTITIGGITIDFSILPEDAVQVWTQDGTEVSNGDITLDVGTAVTGYGVDVEINSETQTISNWYVLGAKDGKLLITTNTCPETVSLEGTAGFTNSDGTGCPWVTTLNTTAANYSDGDMAESARTIDYDDINRITGYDPTKDGSNAGKVYEYGNKVTYTLKSSSSNSSNKVIWYQGDRQPTTETEAPYFTSFQYWGKNANNEWAWTTLGDGENVTLECTYADYNASSVDSKARTLLFTNTGNYPGDTGSYWLGTPFIFCADDCAGYGLHVIYSTCTQSECIFSASDGAYNIKRGIRPVVSIKSSVKVSDTGVLTK